MLYNTEVLDRQTGELITISAGEWISINELADLYGVGPRKARSGLRKMEFLGIEGANDHARHRIQPWAVSAGLGRRNTTKTKARYPFDVISEEGRAWIASRWSQALAEVEAASSGTRAATARAALIEFQESRGRQAMSVHEGVSWLVHHFDGLTHEEMGGILEVTQQLVSRYVREGQDQKRRAEIRRAAPVLMCSKIRLRGLSSEMNDEQQLSVGKYRSLQHR